ncbi:hypothetical protein LSL4_gp104 [Pseudomonas phage LSL4]|nr:hypothetical protein LSL4_gp104 [Pseudomonas phage LSL4]
MPTLKSAQGRCLSPAPGPSGLLSRMPTECQDEPGVSSLGPGFFIADLACSLLRLRVPLPGVARAIS